MLKKEQRGSSRSSRTQRGHLQWNEVSGFNSSPRRLGPPRHSTHVHTQRHRQLRALRRLMQRGLRTGGPQLESSSRELVGAPRGILASVLLIFHPLTRTDGIRKPESLVLLNGCRTLCSISGRTGTKTALKLWQIWRKCKMAFSRDRQCDRLVPGIPPGR